MKNYFEIIVVILIVRMKEEMGSSKLVYVQWHDFNLTNHNDYIDYIPLEALELSDRHLYDFDLLLN